jgi:hypothetical protein
MLRPVFVFVETFLRKMLKLLNLKRLVTEGWMDRIHPTSRSGGHPCPLPYSILSSPVSLCVCVRERERERGMWVHWHTWCRVSLHSLRDIVFREGVNVTTFTVAMSSSYTVSEKDCTLFFIFIFSRCPVCGEWCKLHWLSGVTQPAWNIPIAELCSR